MNNLTMRSKIRVYWTSNPADMGYGGVPSGGKAGTWKTGKRFELCSVRKAASFDDNLSHFVGPGVHKAISYQHNGIEVDLSALRDMVAMADMPKNL